MNKQINKETVNESALTLITPADLGLVKDETAGVSVSYAIWIRALLQNWRQGTVGCKTRSEVALTNKKPWKQKGTGRARAGSARSPIWRGGGVAFGPQPRVRTLKVNKKTKSKVLSALLHDYADNKSLFALDWEMQGEKPSTSAVAKQMQAVGLQNKKIIVVLDRQDDKYWVSMNNLSNVQYVFFDNMNPYELSLGNCIVVLKKDIYMFKVVVSQWN